MKQPPLNSIPPSILDLAATAEIVGSKEDAASLMDMFVSSIPQTKQEADKAVEERDAKQLRAICHRIKGSTSYFIVPHVIEKLSILHNMLRSQPENVEQWLAAYADFVAAIDELYSMCRGTSIH